MRVSFDLNDAHVAVSFGEHFFWKMRFDRFIDRAQDVLFVLASPVDEADFPGWNRRLDFFQA